MARRKTKAVRLSDEDLAYFRRDMSAMEGDDTDAMLDELIALRSTAGPPVMVESPWSRLTTERLATILYEELDRDQWGDVDPDLLAMVGAGNYTEDDQNHDDAEALGKAIDRVVARLKEEKP